MKTFATSRNIPASPEAVFQAFGDPGKLAAWWGPTGFSNTFHFFRFENGGKWSFTMHGPDGKSYPNESEFREIIPTEKLVIRHLSEPAFTLTVTLAPAEAGTTVGWIQEFDSEQVARNIAHIVEPANEQNLDRLTAAVCGR